MSCGELKEAAVLGVAIPISSRHGTALCCGEESLLTADRRGQGLLKVIGLRIKIQ